ncbi:hypothetical protein ACS0TY_010560 [Phlomoides rotata]
MIGGKDHSLTNGLKDGDLFYSLAKKLVATFDDLLRRIEKYITLKEVCKAKKTELKPSASKKKKAPEVKQCDPETVGRRFWRKFEKYTQLKMHPVEVLQVDVDHPDMKFPYSRSRGPTKPKFDKFCRFHNDYGHNTNYYFHMRDEIERLIQAGHLKEFIYHDRHSSRGQKMKDPEKKQDDNGKAPMINTKDRDQQPQKRSMIQMIMGGPIDEDSFRQRKLNVRKLKTE